MTSTPSDPKTPTAKLIAETIKALGPVAPDQLPHLLRERLKGQIEGDLDVEGYLRHLKETDLRAPRS